MKPPTTVPPKVLKALSDMLQPLIGVQFDVLKLPAAILSAFEPSQIGTIAGALMDACIPRLTDMVKPEDLASIQHIGLTKNAGILKDREGYPDYLHSSGLRVELKLLYVDPVGVKMKRASTPRESSARLTQKVTVKNVDRKKDVLLVVAYQLKPDKTNPKLYVPTIVDFIALPVAECIDARDERLRAKGGKWFGNYEVPAVLSKAGKMKRKKKLPINDEAYGRKESEGFDYNEDTNFGKMARIPYPPLRAFIRKYEYIKPVEAAEAIAESLTAGDIQEIKEATKAASKVEEEQN
jgi:hypothetical protein